MDSSNLQSAFAGRPTRPEEFAAIPLNVLNVAYPLLPVHSGSGGGAEQILHFVDRGLTEFGHRSLVLAARGSQVRGRLLETVAAEGQIDDAARERAQRQHRQAIEAALERFPVDLIHFHGLDFFSYLPQRSVPKFATLHLPLAWYPAEIFETKELALNCVSHAQAATAPRNLRLPVVENGIDVDAFAERSNRGKGLLWLGRICPEKGTDIALRVAHSVGLPLTIAGPVHPFEWHQLYFREKVAPLLDEERRYMGPVDLEQKRELLAQADCVLIPSLAPETSSLVAMEAAASGTPVIAFSTGALPEIVEHEKTGFIVGNEDEAARAIQHVRTISPQVCRETATRRFRFSSMVRRYIALYDQIRERPSTAVSRDDQPAFRNDS